jgi:hypothetical protein
VPRASALRWIGFPSRGAVFSRLKRPVDESMRSNRFLHVRQTQSSVTRSRKKTADDATDGKLPARQAILQHFDPAPSQSAPSPPLICREIAWIMGMLRARED